MKSLVNLLVSKWALFYLAVSVLLLVTVYIIQYGFGYEPCELCYYQRYPYMIAIPVAAIAFLTRHRIDIAMKRAARGFLIILIFLMFLGAFLAAHHVGVELGYWQAFTACVAPELGPDATSEEILRYMTEARIIPCDQPEWTLFGISLAGYNLIISMVLAFFGIYIYRRTR